MGAEFVLTGSVNQCTPEAGTSQVAKEMLLQAGMADCAEGPAPDMFELGAHVQVLSRGTMYAKRGQRLYEMYKQYGAWEEVPAVDRAKVEKQILQAPFEEIWKGTRDYWQGRDPAQVVRAESNGRHKMALVFRWYLGMTSRWARMGEPKRKLDYQIWCGPSMGAFNAWVAGTPMEPLSARKVADIAQSADRWQHSAAARPGTRRPGGLHCLKVPGTPVRSRLEPVAPGAFLLHTGLADGRCPRLCPGALQTQSAGCDGRMFRDR